MLTHSPLQKRILEFLCGHNKMILIINDNQVIESPPLRSFSVAINIPDVCDDMCKVVN